MKTYFLRVEGVNLANFIFDTNDLSTIRGGGLLLLGAPKWVKEKFEEKIELKAITQGASWGLFSFQADGDIMAAWVVDQIYKEIEKDCNYQHATLVADVLPAGDTNDYPIIKNKLEALNRWRQMQSPSIVPPQNNGCFVVEEEKPVDAPKGKVCQLDHVRPAVANIEKGTDRFDVSLSVFRRRKYGIENKGREWHKERAKIYDEDFPKFVIDFNELTTPWEKKQDFGNLKSKMAVIYLDGNKFGERQRTFCNSPEKQKEFDRKIRKTYQDGALKEILECIKSDPDWLYDKKLCFETLLWGGDEIIWVVPAWKGWWMLGRFYEEVVTKNWEFPKGKGLTLAAGLVFCHHNAPIHRIVRLAKALGDLAKHDRERNLVAYQILESFDHAGVDIEEFRAWRCPEGILSHNLLIDGNKMMQTIKSVSALKETLPKRRLQRLVQDLYAGISPADNPWQDLEETTKKHIPELKSCFGKSNAVWLHLLELWDYIGTGKQEKGGDDVSG